MTCAKTTVVCSLYGANGNHLISASNGCRNPQSVCPRVPGEDYTKCKTICNQQGHAEIQALAVARAQNINLNGATAKIMGHTYACRECQEALYAAGIKFISVRLV